MLSVHVKSYNVFSIRRQCETSKRTERSTVDSNCVCTHSLKFQAAPSSFGKCFSYSTCQQDDCKALQGVVRHLADYHGVSIDKILRPFVFSIDAVATHIHMCIMSAVWVQASWRPTQRKGLQSPHQMQKNWPPKNIKTFPWNYVAGFVQKTRRIT